MSQLRRTGLPLLHKLALASASVVAYAVLAQVAPLLEALRGIPEPGRWFHPVVGLVFGALVMAPYARHPGRVLRAALLAVASGAIYYGAVWFVLSGPISRNALTSFVLSGAGAAVLAGIAVAVIAPRRYGLRTFALTLAAGAAGGAAFGLRLPFDPHLAVPHAAWQLLACLALHAGGRVTSSSAS